MRHEKNPLQSFTIGIAGGLIGTLAMDYYQQSIAPQLFPQAENQQASQNSSADSISLIGRQYRQDESSTDALGRIAYTQVKGYEPDKVTKATLSNTVHWSYGLLQGGLYGLARAGVNDLDIPGGLAFGAGLYLLGDEMAVPMLGLQNGPTAFSAGEHLQGIATHLVYGVATAVATQCLHRLINKNG